MSDENETNPTPEEDHPESPPGGEQGEDTPSDAQPEGEQVEAADIVGEDAEMTPEEAETLAAAMAAINQVEGKDEPPAEEEPEMTPEEAETLAAAMAAINQVQGVADSVAPTEPDAKPFESPTLSNDPSSAPKEGMDLLSDVHMDVRIELGRAKMYVEDVLKLNDGAVVELDKLAGDPVDVFVNNRKVAKGEVLVLNDLFCVRISEIVDISATDE